MAINTLPRRLPRSRVSGGEAVTLFSIVGLGLGLGLAVLFVVLSLVSGLVFHYAWDVIVMHTFRSAPHVNIAESIGLAMMVGYYANYTQTKDERIPGVQIGTVGFRIGFFLLTIYVLHFFIPGA